MHLSQQSIRRDPPRILLLGGTTEAFHLAEQLAHRSDFLTISSLAGRVRRPRLPMGLVRVGGFGGLSGLTAYLANEKIEAVIDATHPFAAKISGAAGAACTLLGIPLIALERPPWQQLEQDTWNNMPNAEAAADLVNIKGNRVFLSIGRQEIGAFSNCRDAWFLIRAIEKPEADLPIHSEIILDRGPFCVSSELRMFHENSINCVVSKNSGGAATYSKIEAARALQIPVVMIERPFKHKRPTVSNVDDVLPLLAQIFGG